MLTIRPCELKDANRFILAHHRHHKPVQGHRFSVSAWDREGRMVGVVCVGRPVARMTNQREVLEVTRLCTDGTPNACSKLYSVAARIGKEMGYRSIQTFILATESGTSLRACGWRNVGISRGGTWDREGRRRKGGVNDRKRKYEFSLNPAKPPATQGEGKG